MYPVPMDICSAAAKAARLRATAAECRDLARMISLRPDAERLQEMARRYEAEAQALEQSSPATS
jgi:hypothetical protein